MTSEEFFRNKIKELYPFKETITLSQELITGEQGLRWAHEFMKFHVEAALKQASEKAKIDSEYIDHVGEFEDIPEYNYTINKKSILTSYPLENIK